MKLNDCKQGIKVVCRGKVGVIRTRGNRLVTVVMEDGSRGHYHPGNLLLETDIGPILTPGPRELVTSGFGCLAQDEVERPLLNLTK